MCLEFIALEIAQYRFFRADFAPKTLCVREYLYRLLLFLFCGDFFATRFFDASCATCVSCAPLRVVLPRKFILRHRFRDATICIVSLPLGLAYATSCRFAGGNLFHVIAFAMRQSAPFRFRKGLQKTQLKNWNFFSC